MQNFLGPLDTEVFTAYAKKRSPIIQATENRIRIYNKEDRSYCYSASSANNMPNKSFPFLAIVISLIFLA